MIISLLRCKTCLDCIHVLVGKRILSCQYLHTFKAFSVNQESHRCVEQNGWSQSLTQHCLQQSRPQSIQFCLIVDACQSFEESKSRYWISRDIWHCSDQVRAGFFFKIPGHNTDFDLIHDAFCKQIRAAWHRLDSLGGNLTLLFVLARRENV